MEKGHMDRLTIGQYVGTLLWIVLLETRVVSRPMSFLLGPWLICGCFLVADPSRFRQKWGRDLLLSGALSVLGYLVTKLVLRLG